MIDRTVEVARERGVPAAQVALAAAELRLTEDEIARLQEPYRPHPLP